MNSHTALSGGEYDDDLGIGGREAFSRTEEFKEQFRDVIRAEGVCML